jgi:hypothetical protein
MPKNKTRKIKGRKAPEESATSLPEGTMRQGWVIKKASNGVPRWMPKLSVELNGFRIFTTDIAAKHIGKPIMIYCREYKDTWPSKNDWLRKKDPADLVLKFTATGNAVKEKTTIEGWLKTQKPEIQKSTHFYLDGPLYECMGKKCDKYFANGLQVDSTTGKILSLNLMNIEVFVKI